MTPLLDQPFSQSDVSRITAQLKSKGITYNVSGDRILVATDRQTEALADIAFARMLPHNSEAGFEQMAAKLSPWAPESERAAMYNRGKEITCSKLISMFPDVEFAEVVIDPTKKFHIGNSVEPSAIVTITMREGAPAGARQVADAAASVVVGAQAGMRPSRVNVTVNGVPQRIREPGDNTVAGAGDDQFELVASFEKRHRDKIEEVLGYVPHLLVSVNATINTDVVEKDEQKINGKDTVSKPIEEETTESEQSDGQPASGEPGANPNIAGGASATANGPLDINSGGGSGGTSSRQTSEKTKYTLLPDMTHIKTRQGPGKMQIVSASVRVPRSYFVNALKQQNPDGKTPDPAAVDKYAATAMKEMEQAVRGSTGMAADTLVSIASFDDATPTLAAGAPGTPGAVPQTATMSVPGVIGSHGKEIALGGLALVSLFMVTMMVRKSAPPVAVAPPAQAGPPPSLVAGEALAGEAGEGNPLLDGMEMDEDTIRTQQMVEQVSTMVKENPDAAASLMKRWLHRD
jgi:flagellar biosynthesis/type III secretory pathway M-ring protein FliF/YscJ